MVFYYYIFFLFLSVKSSCHTVLILFKSIFCPANHQEHMLYLTNTSYAQTNT